MSTLQASDVTTNRLFLLLNKVVYTANIYRGVKVVACKLCPKNLAKKNSNLQAKHSTAERQPQPTRIVMLLK